MSLSDEERRIMVELELERAEKNNATVPHTCRAEILGYIS